MHKAAVTQGKWPASWTCLGKAAVWRQAAPESHVSVLSGSEAAQQQSAGPHMSRSDG